MKDTSYKYKCQWEKTTGSGQHIRVHRCAKIQAEDSTFCPHHALITASEDEEIGRRMEKARAGKERKAAMREYLKTSPLRAFNPNAGTTYSR